MMNFWRGKKVLVTGHTGFKGSWLSLWLQQLNAHVIGYALSPPTKTNLFTKANVSAGMDNIRGDVRDYKKLNDVIKHHQPEIILHLAAQPLVRYSYAHPVETYETNVLGTVYLLEAARDCSSVRVVLNVTTDKCYENIEKSLGYKESDPMGGYDPYSSSKGCSELISHAYRKSFYGNEVGLATARAGNVIGGGDWAQDRLLPDLILSCVNQSPVQIRYPNAVRPWQHVLESLSGYLALAQRLYENPHEYSQAWNFGPSSNDDKTVGWVADQVFSLWGTDLERPILSDSIHPHETNYLRLDITKARTLLDWNPKWDVQKALDATVAWYKSYYNGANPKELTLQQIADYMKWDKHD